MTKPKQKTKSSVILGLIMLLWLLSPLFLGIYIVQQSYKISCLKDEVQQIESDLRLIKERVIDPPEASPSATLAPSPVPVERDLQETRPTEEQVSAWTGKVSHYSRSGCIGCSATLIMANGQPLDDEELTIAFNKLPLGTKVRITNLDNGKSLVVTVTDRGGFERLGRIADLVPAVARELETKTDVSNVKIEEI